MTRDPEVTLGSLGEFETRPDCVPVMDTGQQFARIALRTMGDHGFDQGANRVAKVRNVSSVGSQTFATGSIRGPTGWRRFETCPVWGAKPCGGISLCENLLQRPQCGGER